MTEWRVNVRLIQNFYIREERIAGHACPPELSTREIRRYLHRHNVGQVIAGKNLTR